MIIDNLDIRGVNRCTNYCAATDSFNRPDMTGGLGVSDIGIAWGPAGGGGTIGITSGRLTQSDGTGSYNDISLPVTMEIPIHATFEIWPVDTTFTIITTLVCGDVTAIVQYRQWEGDGTLGDIVISLSDGTNYITNTTSSIVMFSGMSGVVTIDLTSDTLTTSIAYGYGGGSVSLFVTTAGADPGPIAPITEAATNWAWNIDAPYGTVGIDNLSVGLGNCVDPNHPCYQDCSGSFHDDFNRVVGDCTDVAGWGNGWTAGGGWVQRLCVDGSAAHYYTSSYGDGGQWSAEHGIASQWPVGELFHASFTSFDIDGNGLNVFVGNDTDRLEVSWSPNQYTPNNDVIFYAAIGGVGGNASVVAGLHFGTEWASATGIDISINYLGSSVTATVIVDGVTYTLGPVAVGTPTGPITGVAVGGGGGGVVNAFTLDDIFVSGCVDVYGAPASSGAPGAGGYWCETLAHTGTSTYVTSVPYTSGSLEVYVSGIEQIPYVHFTEHDPATGSILFTFTPGTSETVRVCYVVRN